MKSSKWSKLGEGRGRFEDKEVEENLKEVDSQRFSRERASNRWIGHY